MSINWIPPQAKNSQGEFRRVGVEIELAGVTPSQMETAIKDLFGGELLRTSSFEFEIKDTELGTFKIELDSSLIKRIGKSIDNPSHNTEAQAEKSAEQLAMELISSAAEQLVPWEIVTAPVPVDKLEKLVKLVNGLRECGAKGTFYAARYAFGVHLNPELPDLTARTILNYIRAYLVVYPLIVEVEGIDFSRRVTPYINHFGTDYQKLVLNKDYAPNIETLIDDYLKFNPTRNRSLDLLPLFAEIDKERVDRVVNDKRIKSRPTFHYRLPNCDIDNAEWNLDIPWRHWLWVEYLASDEAKLNLIVAEFYQEVSRLTYHLDSQWHSTVRDFLDENFDN